MTNLRARQRALARTAIVEACAELVAERHQLDFTIREVADRAGVSLRTVYNHFETREDLLDAVGETFIEQMRTLGGMMIGDVEDYEGVLASIDVNHAVFEQMGGISEAFAQLPMEDIGRDEARRERTEAITSLLAAAMSGVPEQDARVIGVTLRHLLSHRSWFWLTREYGLSTPQTTAVMDWCIRTLVEAAARGDGPELPD